MVDPAFIKELLREFPDVQGWANVQYGLDDLDYEDFVDELSRFLAFNLNLI